METGARIIFYQLFSEACRKCFGSGLRDPLNETEARHFSNEILNATGLVIGAKSLKNFSIDVTTAAGLESPSTATLDTLARYVLEAPYTSETDRKNKEGHFPYWFQYRRQPLATTHAVVAALPPKRSGYQWAVAALIILLGFMAWWFFRPKVPSTFTEQFGNLSQDSLRKRGWHIIAAAEPWWGRRKDSSEGLLLYTLSGDNWPDSARAPLIRNLLLRLIESECFSAELRMEDFQPRRNWQQAGLLLLEDTLPGSRSVRLSIGYNDFFGGYAQDPEIILQGVAVPGVPGGKPEELIHVPLHTLRPGEESTVYSNLRKTGVRIEKNEQVFRFLYSTSPIENYGYREAFKTTLAINPRYIGIFALQGFTADSGAVAVRCRYFQLSGMKCR
jgi:hypothetical protein